MRLALFQPDQAGNVGTILRTAACLHVPVDIIEPTAFVERPRAPPRGDGYAELAELRRHADWDAFAAKLEGRLVLLTTHGGARSLDQARFRPGDVLLMGSESAGVPPPVHARADLRVRIPQAAGTRS
jgi:tRNA (cytidine/uridine-2'-O-)-methyltransferase